MGSIPVAKASPILRWSFPRRGLTLALVLLTALAVCGVMLAVGWPKPQPSIWVDGGRLSDLEVGQPFHPARAPFWLVLGEDGSVTALATRSPHLGCGIGWREDFAFEGSTGWFRDPCSGSNFDATGAIHSGPAPRGMDGYEVSVTDGMIRVRVDEIICSDGSARCGPPHPEYPGYVAPQSE